jgi:hypothetical protein
MKATIRDITTNVKQINLYDESEWTSRQHYMTGTTVNGIQDVVSLYASNNDINIYQHIYAANEFVLVLTEKPKADAGYKGL